MKRASLTPGALSAIGLQAVLLLAAVPARADFLVTKTADTNDGVCNLDCSLREAIVAANASFGNDTITLLGGTYKITLAGAGEDSGATGDLDVTDGITLNGLATAATIIDGNGLDRVFDVHAGLFWLSRLTVRNGQAPGDGGGIRSAGDLLLDRVVVESCSADAGGGGVYSSGTATLIQSTLRGNSSSGGGGIAHVASDLRLTDSTVSGNSVYSVVPHGAGFGGGILAGDETVLSNTTVSGNSADGPGGGFGGGIFVQGDLVVASSTVAYNDAILLGSPSSIYVTSGTGTFVNSIVAGACNATTAPYSSSGGDVESPDDTCGFDAATDHPNVTAAALNLGPLGNNGGLTQTHAVLPGSIAIDAGFDISCTEADQRGVTRPQGPECDSGSYERRPGCIGSIVSVDASGHLRMLDLGGVAIPFVALILARLTRRSRRGRA